MSYLPVNDYWQSMNFYCQNTRYRVIKDSEKKKSAPLTQKRKKMQKFMVQIWIE